MIITGDAAEVRACRKTSSSFTLPRTKAVRTGLRLKLHLRREKLTTAIATE